MEKDPQKRKCILFSGVPGCSKTPTAIFLSCKLQLPIFNNDAIRSEVIEDLGGFENNEYIKRRDQRFFELIKRGDSFILDASVDRKYEQVKEYLREEGYEIFLISFELGDAFVERLWKNKGYDTFLVQKEKWLNDNKIFLKNFSKEIGLIINENNFKDRLNISHQKAEEFIFGGN